MQSNWGPRTLRNYNEWTRNIKELDTPVEIDWISVSKGKNRITFSLEKVGFIHSALNNLSNSTNEEEIDITGRLTGANVRKQTFEIIDEDDNRFTGRIAKDAIPYVAKFELDKKCIAHMIKFTVNDPVKKRVSWTLNGISEF